MARDSSPFAKRLKGLAARAGLPVDDAPATAPAASAPQTAAIPEPTPETEPVTAPQPEAAADEQPTGDSPAVSESPDATDAQSTPPGEQPTGKIAAITEGSFDPPAPEPQPPVGPAPSPVWMDPLAHDDIPDPTPPASSFGWPAEHPSPPADSIYAPDPAPADSVYAPDPIRALPDPPSEPPAPNRPTLSPPVLRKSSSDQRWPEPTPQDQAPEAPQPVADEPSPQDSSETSVETPPSKAAELHDALALPADDPAPAADATPEPETSPIEDEQPTIVAPVLVVPAAAPDAPSADAESPSAASAESSSDQETTAAEAPTPTPDPSFTGRFAALRKRVRPGSPVPAPVIEESAPAPSGTDAAASKVTEPVAAEPEPTPEPAAADPTPPVPFALAEPLPVKPSFAERASLRRRVKTLRARRDTGLLELGAIVLDQRRFGDPTAGALVRRRTDELADLDNEIAAMENVLDGEVPATAIDELGTVRCLSCNTLVGPADLFCAHCGTPRPGVSGDGGPAGAA